MTLGKESFCMGQGETMRNGVDLMDQSPRERASRTVYKSEEINHRKANLRLGLQIRVGQKLSRYKAW